MTFELNERLAAGGFDFGTQGICRVLLKDNAVFPWFILVPEVDEQITELHQLDAADYGSIMSTVRQMSQFVDSYFKPDKVNVAAIGNIVKQLHIHVVARYETDPAWPGVIWGCSEKKTYENDALEAIRDAYQHHAF
ncbi:MAG: HIT family protein [Akkermansiaceae bacterium]|nr:HIT family protein [Akkermansiaceae bacterium]